MKVNSFSLSLLIAGVFCANTAVNAVSLKSLPGANKNQDYIKVEEVGSKDFVSDGETVSCVVSLGEEVEKDVDEDEPIEIYFDGPGLVCSKFALPFNRESQNSKVLKFRPLGGLSPNRKNGELYDASINYRIKTKKKEYSGSKTYKRKCVTPGNGGAWGDPHYTSMDGQTFDFMEPGVFTLFNAGNMNIQVTQQKCGAQKAVRPACYDGAAVQYGSSSVTISVDPNDGKITVNQATQDKQQWLSVGKSAANSYRIFFSADPGSFLDVVPYAWMKGYYFNVALFATPYFKKPGVFGLLGNWNDKKDDDLRDSKKLAAANAVDPSQNLFLTSSPTPTPITDDDFLGLQQPPNPAITKAFTIITPPSAPTGASAVVLFEEAEDLKLTARRQHLDRGRRRSFRQTNADEPVQESAQALEASEADGEDNNAGDDETVHILDEAPSDNFSEEKVKTLCNQVIDSISVCHKYVPNTDFFINNVCIEDGILLRDLSVIDNVKVSYLRQCKRGIEERLESQTGTPADDALLHADLASLSFSGQHPCTADCSHKGVCEPAGCQCNAGYTGYFCEISLAD